jgi:hypothetical protein
MPARAQLLNDMGRADAVGVLLMVQMDGVPETLQLVVTTTVIDQSRGGLRETGHYVIRAIGVIEHRVSVGMFGTLAFVDGQHPLLYAHNATPAALFFRGKAPDANALLVDVLQAYASTFGEWRQVPEYFNRSKSLLALLTSPGDLLGEMPQPLADALVPVLEAHGLETLVKHGETPLAIDEHGRSQHRQALLIDDSYVVALEFSVEPLGTRGASPA